MGVIKSKSDAVTLIEDLISRNEIKQSDQKVINFDEVSDDVEFSDLELKLSSGFNYLFSQVFELKKTLKDVQLQLEASLISKEAGNGGNEVKGGNEVEGGAEGGGEESRRNVGGLRDNTVDQNGSKSWVTPSNSEVLKENRWFKKRVELMESEVDEIGQRGLKGMVVVSAPDFKYQDGNKVKVDSLFKDMVSFKPEEGEPPSKEEELADLKEILSLIEKKYGVKVPVSEVYGCHFLPNGMYCLRFVYRNPTNSKWADLMSKIKSGEGTDMHLYCNVQLTRKRRQLFNAVRSLKFYKRIQQYKVDVNGAISIKLKDKWMKITHHYSSKGEIIPTKLPNELDRIISG